MYTSIGSRNNMYLFLGSGNAGVFADSLVISAHGGIRKTRSPTFRIQYGQLQFYSEHGEPATDFGIEDFKRGDGRTANRKTKPLNIGEECWNYDLSKYQGKKHNKAGEDYDSIEAAQASTNTIVNQREEARKQGKKIPGIYESYKNFDVLTIRNKYLEPGVNLQQALHEVGKIHKYNLIHCYFCRSFYFY